MWPERPVSCFFKWYPVGGSVLCLGQNPSWGLARAGLDIRLVQTEDETSMFVRHSSVQTPKKARLFLPNSSDEIISSCSRTGQEFNRSTPTRSPATFRTSHLTQWDIENEHGMSESKYPLDQNPSVRVRPLASR